MSQTSISETEQAKAAAGYSGELSVDRPHRLADACRVKSDLVPIGIEPGFWQVRYRFSARAVELDDREPPLW